MSFHAGWMLEEMIADARIAARSVFLSDRTEVADGDRIGYQVRVASELEEPHRKLLEMFDAELAEARSWPLRARVRFANLERQKEVLRYVFLDVGGSELPERPGLDDYWTSYYPGADGGGLRTDFESGNYGLGFTITRFKLLVSGQAWVLTEDREFDNCGAEGGDFEIGASSDVALERVVAALVRWHASQGISSFDRDRGQSQDNR